MTPAHHISFYLSITKKRPQGPAEIHPDTHEQKEDNEQNTDRPV
jgi:hypothetical protein